MITYREVWSRIPAYSHFSPMPELNERLKGLVAEHHGDADLFEIGRSREGAPLYGLRIGNGSQRALWFACPHPNEPIGSLVIESMANWLLADRAFRERMDTTWYLVPCVDPDATALNEGWFRGPFTVTHYARHYYRPPSADQVEWSFPATYRRFSFQEPLPETEALMRLIDEVKPHMLYSLHNAGFGGVYYYITRRASDEALYRALHRQVAESGLPLALGEPEMPWARTLDKAIYELTGVKEQYDHYASLVPEEEVPGMMHGGGGSVDYSRQYDTYCLVCEVPYFYDARIADERPSGKLRRDVLEDGLQIQEAWHAFVAPRLDKVEPHVNASPFLATISELVEKMPQRIAAMRALLTSDPTAQQPATVAQAFDSESIHRFFLTLNLGVFRRLLHLPDTVERVPSDALAKIQSETDAFFDAWCDTLERGLNYEAVPIRKLVALQTAAGVATLEHLAHSM